MASSGTRPSTLMLPAFLLVGLCVAYPVAVDVALERFGVRTVAGAALTLGLLFIAVAGRLEHARQGPATAPQLLTAGLAAAALVTGDRWPLLFVPAVIQVGLAWFFLASLRDADSIVERVAKIMQPLVPGWIDGYCRTITVLWSLFFGANAVLIVWLALESPRQGWVAYTGVGLWVAVCALQLTEFLVRKAWFRYYGGTFVDRLLQPLFPPENTARGRRSMEYIRSVQSGMAGKG